MPNYIRVKQINQGELTGFFVDSISSESGLLLDFAEQAALAVFSSGTVLLTGNQNISGNKTFLNNLNVSGDVTIAGTLRYNEIIDTTVTGNISGYTGIFDSIYANNIIYNTGNNILFITGDQNVSGNKTFLDNLNISGDLTLNGGLYINDIEELNLTGANIYADNLVYNTGNQIISGVKTIEDLKTKNLYLNDLLPENSGVTFKLNDGDLQVSNKSGVRFGLSDLSALPFTGLNNIVLTSNNTTIKLPPNKNDFIAMSSEVVYNTGNQTISGVKTFTEISCLKNATLSGDVINKNYADENLVKYIDNTLSSNTNLDLSFPTGLSGIKKINYTLRQPAGFGWGVNYNNITWLTSAPPNPTTSSPVVFEYYPSGPNSTQSYGIYINAIADLEKNRSTIVYTTGNQTISGTKIFAGSLGLGDANNPNSNKLYFYDTGTVAYNTIQTYSDDFSTYTIFEFSDQGSTSKISIDLVSKTISGANNSAINFSNRPTVNGTGVLLSGEAAQVDLSTTIRTTGNQTVSGVKTFATGIFAPNLVYNTGDQTISGNKTFIDNISVSGTGIFNALDLNNIDNLSLSGVDVAINSSSNLSVTNSNVTFSGNNINFENQNNINLAYQFPAWTGIRRYAPLSLQSIATPSFPTTGIVVYFPFLIKKKIINPVACVEMTSHTSDPEIVMGIYSGHYGLQNAKLIASGSITGNSLNTGIYRTTLNGTFDQGPYIVASVLKSGRGAFRIAGNQSFREHFGIDTGSSILHGINNTASAHILYESGIYLNDTLPTNIGQELYWSISSANSAPVVFLEY